MRVRLLRDLPRTKTFKRLTDAKASAAKVESDMGHGTYIPTTVDRRRTLHDLIEKCRTEQLPTHELRGADKQPPLLQWWDDNDGRLTLDKLGSEAIGEARKKLLAHKKRAGEPLAVRR